MVDNDDRRVIDVINRAVEQVVALLDIGGELAVVAEAPISGSDTTGKHSLNPSTVPVRVSPQQPHVSEISHSQ